MLFCQIAKTQNESAHMDIRMSGGLTDPYGDGEQTKLSGQEAQIIRTRWGK